MTDDAMAEGVLHTQTADLPNGFHHHLHHHHHPNSVDGSEGGNVEEEEGVVARYMN
jgi:hypothetical protein